MTIGLLAIVTAGNFTAEGLLISNLLKGGGGGGRSLVMAAAAIWFTNVAVFGLWFWEIDRGGPHMRTSAKPDAPDFLFPQMTAGGPTERDWRREPDRDPIQIEPHLRSASLPPRTHGHRSPARAASFRRTSIRVAISGLGETRF